VRSLGGSETAAWIVQGAVICACVAVIFFLWRSRVGHELKAAALATGALIATPYLYIYDLVILAIAVAYLARIGIRQGFTLLERLGLPVVGLLLLSYPYLKVQVGLAAALIVAFLVAQRIWLQRDHR